MLPNSYEPSKAPSYLNNLSARDPVNTNAPGLKGNKNGPPGPEGNKKGPPIKTVSIESSPLLPPPLPSTTSTPPPSPSTSTLPITTSTSSTTSGLTSDSVIATSSPTSSTYLITSTNPNTSTLKLSTISDITTSSGETLTTVTYLVSVSSSIEPVLFTVSSETTALQTTFTSMSSTSPATTEQPLAVSSTPSGTARFASNTLPTGQRVGISIGAIAGFALLVALIFLLFKRFKIKLPRTLPSYVRTILGKCGGCCWLSGRKPAKELPVSLLNEKANSNGTPIWDYQESFARPTMIQRARQSLHNSLARLSQINPLGLNPIGSQTIRAGTPNRKSFSSFFHRRSVASTQPNASLVSIFSDESGSTSVPPPPPPLPPEYTAFLSIRPSSMPEWPAGPVQDDKSNPLLNLEKPPRTLKPISHHRSFITNIPTDNKAHSAKHVPGWVKFHLPSKLRSGVAVAQASEKDLPPIPLS